MCRLRWSRSATTACIAETRPRLIDLLVSAQLAGRLGPVAQAVRDTFFDPVAYAIGSTQPRVVPGRALSDPRIAQFHPWRQPQAARQRVEEASHLSVLDSTRVQRLAQGKIQPMSIGRRGAGFFLQCEQARVKI